MCLNQVDNVLKPSRSCVYSRKQNQVDQEPRESRSIQKHELDQEPRKGRSRITASFAMCLKPLFPENQVDQEPRGLIKNHAKFARPLNTPNSNNL